MQKTLIMLVLLNLVLGDVDKCDLTVDDIFECVDKLPRLPSGDQARAFR
jgi:hypothetical protein